MSGRPVTDGFIRQLRGAATIMGGVQVDAVSDAAKAVKPVMEASVASMTGGDMRLRNVRSKAGIKVNYRVQPGGLAGAYARFTATGPIALIEKGAPAHDIAPKRSRRGRKRGAVNTPYGPYARVRHPGFTGKGRWAAARDSVAANSAARGAFLGRNVTAFRKAFS
jgi:hypothetical protein